MSRKFIYGLIDPRDGQIRYVGQSSVGMKRAEVLHSAKCKSWQMSLRSQNLREEVEIIEETEDLNDAEMFWIAYFRMIGADLTNLTAGGEGLKNCSEETRRKLRDCKLGTKLSEDHKRKIRLATEGKHTQKFSEEYRLKLSAAKKGRKLSANHRAAISAAAIGKKRGPYRPRIST